MSKIQNYIIYSNLPSGGAKNIFNITKKFLANNLISTNFINPDSSIKTSNIISYLLEGLLGSYFRHKKALKKFNNKDTILIAYQTWLTNSPHILRLWKGKSLYVCHEPMREYYDAKHIRSQSFINRVVNLIRVPLRRIDAINARSAGLVVSNSNFSRKAIKNAYGINSVVVYPGINVDNYLKYYVKINQVITVGAINKLKGYEHVIYVLSKIKDKNRPMLKIIGNGSNKKYEKKLIALAESLNVKIIIKKNIKSVELIKEYSQSKLFLYSPINEPFGVVVLEAMAAGLPLAVYGKGGGYSEILTSNNGLVFSNLNTDDWAKKITLLLNDNPKLLKLSKYNIEHAKSYKSSVMNNKLLKLIKNL